VEPEACRAASLAETYTYLYSRVLVCLANIAPSSVTSASHNAGQIHWADIAAQELG